jgi:membrane protease YdiL (CAAX protease family)
VRVVLRAKLLIIGCAVLAGVAALSGLLGTGAQGATASGRAISGVVGLVALAVALRLTTVGLRLDPGLVTIRGLTTTDRIQRVDVQGLAQQPVGCHRFTRLAVVTVDGRVIPAVWTIARASDDGWVRRGAWAAYGFGPTQPQVASVLNGVGRLAATDVLPTATPDPGLTPETVSPLDTVIPQRWVGWETVFVVTAFALPGVAAAIEILAQHLEGVSDLNEFALPLPHHPAPSLVILLVGYLSTALVVPIALLLLARTGQPPASLGLTRSGFRRDLVGAVGLLIGVYALSLVVLLPLSHFLNNKHLSNTASNSHVPPYFLIYALVVSATTAINEEVIVNGYFLTRLSQLGWSPRAALLMSLAVRTSYHAYYGVGLIATVPFGYLVTRSFQKRGRLTRPILTHFFYDAIILVIAVLTS